MGIKACDSQMMALCVECHHAIDQGGKLHKEVRRAIELAFVKATRQRLVNAGKWTIEAQTAFERATNAH